jgi:hypothetical protein
VNTKLESLLSIAVAIFVLLTAMLEPRLSAGLAVLFLVGMGLYKYVRGLEQSTR